MDVDEELLAHYGIKGMKWGKRQSKSVTGVSRATGARIDRNDRMISRIQNVRKGKGLVRDRVGIGIDRAIIGKKLSDKYLNMQVSKMQSQNARLKRGKSTTLDRLQVRLSVTPIDFVMSNRPK